MMWDNREIIVAYTKTQYSTFWPMNADELQQGSLKFFQLLSYQRKPAGLGVFALIPVDLSNHNLVDDDWEWLQFQVEKNRTQGKPAGKLPMPLVVLVLVVSVDDYGSSFIG